MPISYMHIVIAWLELGCGAVQKIRLPNPEIVCHPVYPSGVISDIIFSPEYSRSNSGPFTLRGACFEVGETKEIAKLRLGI